MAAARAAVGLARSRPFSWPFVLSVTLLVLIVFRAEIASSALFTMSWAATAVMALCLMALYRADGGRRISLGILFGAFLGMFHLGLLFATAFGVPLRILSAADMGWVVAAGFSLAGVYAVIGLVSYTWGYALLRSRGTKLTVQLAASTSGESQLRRHNGILGALITLTGLSLWVWNVLAAGVVFGDGYVGYLNKTAGSSMPWAFLGIGLGLGMMGAGHRSGLTRGSLAAFCIWAPLAFMLGLRGEVLMPAAAYLVAMSRRRVVHFDVPRLTIGSLALLSLGSLVRVFRVGALDSATVWTSLNPAAGLVELGYSVRPLLLAMQWHIADGEPFVGVATYVAPLRRLVFGTLLGQTVPSVSEDPAVFGGVIGTRIGPVGGSVVAEAYRVGGLVAIMAVLAAIGALCAKADMWRVGAALPDAAVGMLSYVLLLWIRNDFTPVPMEVLMAALALLLVSVWPRVHHVGQGASSQSSVPPRSIPSGV